MWTGEQADDGVTPDARADLDLRWAKIAVHAGSPTTAEKYARRVLDDDDVDEPRRLDALTLLAAATEAQGRVVEAVAILEDLASRIDPDELAELHLSTQAMLIRCHKTVGDYAQAISVGERAMAHFGPDFRDEEMMVVISLADAHTERGDLSRASMYLSTVISRAEQAGSSRVRGAAMWNLSIVASEQGRDDEAVDAAQTALALLGETDADRALGRLHANVGYLLLERADPAEATKARAHFERAAACMADESAADELARLELELARCDLLDGEHDRALGRVLTARSVLDSADDGVAIDLAHADLIQAHVEMARGEVGAAMVLGRRAGQASERLEGARESARVWAAVAVLADGVDDELWGRAMRGAVRCAGVRPTRVGRTTGTTREQQPERVR